MAAGSRKNEREKERKRKKTLLRKAYELGKLCDVDVAVILHKNGRYVTYRSTDKESWLPCMKQIISSIPLYLSPSSNQSSKLYTLLRRICLHGISKVKPRAVSNTEIETKREEGSEMN
jgi:hypothetical protein